MGGGTTSASESAEKLLDRRPGRGKDDITDGLESARGQGVLLKAPSGRVMGPIREHGSPHLEVLLAEGVGVPEALAQIVAPRGC